MNRVNLAIKSLNIFVQHFWVCFFDFSFVFYQTKSGTFFPQHLLNDFFLYKFIIDKQQEFDLPSLRIDENEIAQLAQKTRSRSPRFGGPPMSQISGVSRPLLSHTNSFTGERLPTFGVETPHENALGTLLGDIDTWGIDIFKIGELSCIRPLTSIAYTVFQVNFSFHIFKFNNHLQPITILLSSSSRKYRAEICYLH